MRTPFWKTTLVFAGLLAVSCAGSAKRPHGQAARPASSNVFLAEWTGPYGGVPAFDKMDVAALKPALEVAMAAQLEEIARITADPAPPTFENTILALERVGRVFYRVVTFYGVWIANLSSPEFRKVQEEMEPKLADFNTRIIQDAALFARVKAVRDTGSGRLRPDQKRLVALIYEDFARNGATLTGTAKKRYAAIDQRLAELHTKFGNNLLADEEQYFVLLTKDQLAGLSDSFVRGAAAAATERGKEGAYLVANTRSSVDTFLAFSSERAIREQVWRNFTNRGDNGDEHDNNALIVEILKLRDERVGLLGYDTYAAWRLENQMAKTPDRALELLRAVWPAATARVRQEVADMQAVADAGGAGITIEAWDYRYYAEKVRRAKYDLDSNELSQYLQLDHLREAMFYVAGELFGFRFTPVSDGTVPVFHPDVKVWEVTDRTSGRHVGLWYLDPFARTGKRSGAWATSYREHETLDGEKTVLASNNSNFVKGAPGEPILVSWDNAETFFHEFGHALHTLSSRVDYPRLNAGVRDYTEFQSQLLERWLLTERVLGKYLVHHKTGKPIPAALVAKIKNAATFNQGFMTTESLASALMDLLYHSVDPKDLDPDRFEREELAKLGMPKELVMRHRSPQFAHAFSDEGYSSAYYGYLWADVLTSDAAEAFAEAPGGFYDKDLAKRLVDNLFAVRDAVDPAEAYRAFRGRDAKIDALMRDRGFPVPVASAVR